MASASSSGHTVDLALATSKSVLEMARLLRSRQTSAELRKFYGHLIVHCVFVSDHIDRIRTMLGPENELIMRVLQIFESLIAPGATACLEATQEFPRQHALNPAWGRLRHGSADARLDFATRCLGVEPSPRLGDYDESFDVWEQDVVARYPEDGTQWPVDDRWPPKKSRAEPSYAVWSAAQSLFKALAAATKCQCHPAHELGARLGLGTYRKPHLDGKNYFDMFLASNQVLQEVHVHTVKDSMLRFVVSDQAQPTTKKPDYNYKPMVVKALCEQVAKMQKMASQRLELKVERGRLLKLRSEKSSFRIDKKRPPVPLQHFIQEGSRSLTEKTKRILAVLLSYAVLHLHGTPWLQPTWDSSQILFFPTQSSKIPLRPFIQAQLSGRKAATGLSDPGQREAADMEESLPFDDGPEDLDPDDLYPANLDPDDVEHPLPTLVTLAVMLMELYFATPFNVLASNRGIELPEGLDSRTRSLDVASVFIEYKQEIPQNSQFYHTIQKCLDPRIWQDEGGQMLENQMLRPTVYQEVVRPLEDELCDAFDFITIEDLDQIAETVDVGSWGQTIQQPEDRVGEASTSLVDVTLLNQYRQLMGSPPILSHLPDVGWNLDSMAHSLLGTSQQLSPASEYMAAKFYDNERPSGAHSTQELKNYFVWKADYRSVYKKYIDPFLQDPPQSPVKIAILDSGVDETHNALDTGQIKLRRNWTSKFKRAVHDGDGHGTFTASLIIDYCPDVELYIAKIADKALCPPAVIAEAIKTAVDDWHVDVISMSFGYPTNKIDGYPELEQALLHAHSRNVLMFAAASNSGANLDRAYPARDPHVICIHSTDSHGNRSKFSPTALARDVNIATIGEAIQSAWPVGLCDIDANPDCVQCKSGTSYSTPIAVGIAAFLLQYARIHLAETADLLKHQSRMKDVLLKIAEKSQRSICRDDYNYVALSLYSDNLFGSEKEIIDMTLGELLRR